MAGEHVARRDLLSADRKHQTIAGAGASVDKAVGSGDEGRACGGEDGAVISRNSGQRQHGRPREDDCVGLRHRSAFADCIWRRQQNDPHGGREALGGALFGRQSAQKERARRWWAGVARKMH